MRPWGVFHEVTACARPAPLLHHRHRAQSSEVLNRAYGVVVPHSRRASGARGFIALYAAKGRRSIARSACPSVYTMPPVAVTGMLIAAIENAAPPMNIPSALLTCYLVITALMAVRAPSAGTRRLDRLGMVFAFALAVECFVLGGKAIAGGGAAAGMAYPLWLFGGVAVAAGVGDRLMIRAGGVTAASRLKRHLWRMSFALTLAAMAFFVGQADVFPQPVRIGPLLALPMLAVLATMFTWFWRLRRRSRCCSR
jgi:hypothetical protein